MRRLTETPTGTHHEPHERDMNNEFIQNVAQGGKIVRGCGSEGVERRHVAVSSSSPR